MMKHMLLMGIFILLIVSLKSENEEDWPQLGQDAQHSFFSDTSVSDHLEIVWQYQLEPTYDHASRELFCTHTSPVAVGDRIYILDFRRLYCVSFRTGDLLYEVPASSIYPYSPAVVDGRIYLAAEGNLFRCLDAYTGTTLWEKELPNLYMVSPVADENTVYVTVDHSSSFHIDTSRCGWMATEWSTLVAMDGETGNEIWNYSVTDASVNVMRGIGFPILAEDTIIFYANHYRYERDHDANPKKSSLICLDARTGTLKWKREGILLFSSGDPGGLNPFWIAYYDGKIYIGSQMYMVCIDADTQEPLWEYRDVPGWALLSVGNGVVVVRSWTRVDCLDAETGKELWTISSDGWSLPAMTKNEVFIDSDQNLCRVDIKSGKVTDSYELGGSVYSPVVANGRVLVGTSENRIYCLGQPTFYKVVPIVIAAVVLLVVLLVMRRVKSPSL